VIWAGALALAGRTAEAVAVSSQIDVAASRTHPVPHRATFTLEIVVYGDGETIPAAGVYDNIEEGTHVPLRAVPHYGSAFDRWREDGDIPDPAGSCLETDAGITMDADKTVIAVFETVDVTGRGWIEGVVGPWDDAENWCAHTVPGVVPGESSYEVFIDIGEVTLDASPTIEWFYLANGSVLSVNADSGLDTQTLTVLDTTGSTESAGLLQATDGHELHLVGSVDQTATGLIAAEDGGVIRLEGEVSGTGSYSADGGTIKLSYGATVSGKDMDVGNNGAVELGELAWIGLYGALTLSPGGTLRADPETWYGSMSVDSITIHQGVGGGAPGTMLLNGVGIDVWCYDDFVMDGSGAGPCDPGRSDTPPILGILGEASDVTSRLGVDGDMRLVHSVEIHVGLPGALDNRVVLRGHFDNQSIYPTCFDWVNGTLEMWGEAPQTLETAGQDRMAGLAGFRDNFALGTLELAVDTIVSIADTFDNQQDGQIGCDEVLYIDAITLNSGSQLISDGCFVYYRTLTNDGGLVPGLGTDVLRIADQDFDGDYEVDLADFDYFADCMLGPGVPPNQDCLDAFDVDSDGDVDLRDLGGFQAAFGWPWVD